MKTKTNDKTKAPKGIFSDCKLSFDVGTRLLESVGRNIALKKHRVYEALRAGLLSLIVKDTIAHGHFQKWWAGEIGKLSDFTPKQADNIGRSLRNYMRLASGFIRDLSNVDAGEIMGAHFLTESVTEKNEAAFVKKCPIFAAAVAWIADRSLMEIYQAEGILKAEADGGQHNQRKLSPEEIAQREFSELCDSFKLLSGTVATHLAAGTLGKLPSALRCAFVDAALPAIEQIAETTADLTPAQLKAMEQRLITIGGILRERMKGGSRAAANAA